MKELLVRWTIWTLSLCFFVAAEPSQHNSLPSKADSLQAKLNTKFRDMFNRMRKGPVISITKEAEFRKFILDLPRNYSSFVLFNENPRLPCSNCKSAHIALITVAGTYLRQSEFEAKPVLFFEINQNKLPELTKRLEIAIFPSLLYFPKDGRLTNVEKVDGSEVVFRMLHRVQEYIETTAGIQVMFEKSTPADYSLWMILAFGISVVLYQQRKYVSKYIKKKQVDKDQVAYYIVAIMVLLVSGHVYNYVASPHPFGRTRDGGYDLIAGSQRYQFQVEAYIVAFIYGLYSLGVILLIEGRRDVLNKVARRDRTLVGLVITSVTHFCWANLTRVKLGM